METKEISTIDVKILTKQKFPDPTNGHWWDPEDFRFRTKKARTKRKEFIRFSKTQNQKTK